VDSKLFGNKNLEKRNARGINFFTKMMWSLFIGDNKNN
jgi:hypothetical protein